MPLQPGTPIHNESLLSQVALPPLSQEQQEVIRRRLEGCSILRPWKYRFRLIGCCGRQKCVTPKFKVSGSWRLQVTADVAAIESSMRLQLMAPGMGLASVDKTVSGRFEIAYAEARTVCDFVPQLKEFCLGRIGGGSTVFSIDYLGVKFERKLSFDIADICLVDILPCDKMKI